MSDSHPGRGLRGRLRRGLARRRRDPRQPVRRGARVGARLARATFAPGPAAHRRRGDCSAPAPGRSASRPPARSRAGCRSARSSTSLWGGRRHVMMGPSQIDRYGNANISCIGDFARPKVQLLGVRGAPGQHRQPPHQLLDAAPLDPRTSCRAVDMVSRRRLRPGRRGRARRRALPRPPPRGHQPRRARLRRPPDHAMRLASVHPGVTVDEVRGRDRVRARRRRRRAGDAGADRRGAAADPRGASTPTGCATARSPVSAPAHPALHTRSATCFGVRYPIVQTGMGYVSDAAAHRRHLRRRRPGHPRRRRR